MYHLLIVDDEENFADAFSAGLKREGYQVSIVYAGRDALPELQKKTGIDLVLLDINLNDPLLNGRDIFRQIKKLPQPPLVIMLTALDSVDAQVDGLDYADD